MSTAFAMDVKDETHTGALCRQLLQRMLRSKLKLEVNVDTFSRRVLMSKHILEVSVDSFCNGC